jgi:hypothetical protein
MILFSLEKHRRNGPHVHRSEGMAALNDKGTTGGIADIVALSGFGSSEMGVG